MNLPGTDDDGTASLLLVAVVGVVAAMVVVVASVAGGVLLAAGRAQDAADAAALAAAHAPAAPRAAAAAAATANGAVLTGCDCGRAVVTVTVRVPVAVRVARLAGVDHMTASASATLVAAVSRPSGKSHLVWLRKLRSVDTVVFVGGGTVMDVRDLADEVRSAVERRFPGGLPDGVDPQDVADRFAEFLGVVVGTRRGLSAAARAVGPVCTVSDVAAWSTPVGRPPKTDEAVRKAIREHRLVGFLTADGHYVLPVWQFDADGAVLSPRPDVVAVWQSLPHDAAVTTRYLATWMNGPKTSMGGHTVAEHAHLHGADDEAVHAAVTRLWARLAPPDAA